MVSLWAYTHWPPSGGHHVRSVGATGAEDRHHEPGGGHDPADGVGGPPVHQKRSDHREVNMLNSCLAGREGREEFQYAVRVHSELWFYGDAELARVLDLAQAAGVTTIDTDVVWAALDQGDFDGSEARSTYDWKGLDRLVREAEARGMKVNFQIATTPDWVHPYLAQEVPDKEVRKWYAPRGRAELVHFSAFVEDVARRYKGRVNHYEVWNEPNHEPFWRSGPDPGEYAALLRAAYTSLKAADPAARVVYGGLSLNNLGYLLEYYRAVKSSYPEAASKNYFFDALGLHPYEHPYHPQRAPGRYEQDVIGPLNDGEYDYIGEVDGNFLGFRRMKKLMDAEEHSSAKRLYLSEFGYRIVTGRLSDERRAHFLKRAYKLARSYPYVEGMCWFTFYANDTADPPEWAMLDEDLKPSLTYRALQQVTRANP